MPWGISEAAYNVMDLSMNYQYRAFGVPELGLKPGLGDDLLVAPYATALAALVRARAAHANFGALARAGLGDGMLGSLVVDGVIAGVGAVVVFLPQIAILFLLIAILEESGYLARASFLLDRIFARVGLSGRSFIPLLSSFACAVPGIMATRVIEDRRTRLATRSRTSPTPARSTPATSSSSAALRSCGRARCPTGSRRAT